MMHYVSVSVLQLCNRLMSGNKINKMNELSANLLFIRLMELCRVSGMIATYICGVYVFSIYVLLRGVDGEFGVGNQVYSYSVCIHVMLGQLCFIKGFMVDCT